MTRVGDIGKPAPAVRNFFVLGERVGDQRENPQIVAKNRGERAGRGLAGLFAAILEQIEGWFERQRLGSNLEAEMRDGVVEQTVPRALCGQ